MSNWLLLPAALGAIAPFVIGPLLALDLYLMERRKLLSKKGKDISE